MTYFKLAEIVENWDNIKLTSDVMPKERPTRPDDMDELANRFFNSVFGVEETGDQEEDFMGDEYSENARHC